jgi:hypothetical protein
LAYDWEESEGYKEMSSIFADHDSAGVTGLQPMVQLYTGAQVNFGDLTPNLTYGKNKECFSEKCIVQVCQIFGI